MYFSWRSASGSHLWALEVGGEDFRIDLLFYHLKLRCYLVIDLKGDNAWVRRSVVTRNVKKVRLVQTGIPRQDEFLSFGNRRSAAPSG
jgi:hypothetical protein